MKKRLQGLIAGFLAGALLTGGVVFGKQTTETISVIYDNIKIMIDGKEYHPTDAAGNTIEPFIYNGTTYLPVRAIANAFNKDVDWEAQTSTVTLGSKNYDWLDQMGYADYRTTANESDMKALPSGSRDNDDIKYDRGLQFFLSTEHYLENNDGTKDGRSYQTVEYLLNKNYNSFAGKFISLNASKDAESTIVKVYGDGKLIYTSPVISYGTKAIPFDIDISDYKILKLHVEIQNLTYKYSSRYMPVIGIADARLAKK